MARRKMKAGNGRRGRKQKRFRELPQGEYQAKIVDAKLKGNQVIISFVILGKGGAREHEKILRHGANASQGSDEFIRRTKGLSTKDLSQASLDGDGDRSEKNEPRSDMQFDKNKGSMGKWKVKEQAQVAAPKPNSIVARALAKKQRRQR